MHWFNDQRYRRRKEGRKERKERREGGRKEGRKEGRKGRQEDKQHSTLPVVTTAESVRVGTMRVPCEAKWLQLGF